jgi:hypothetical protein
VQPHDLVVERSFEAVIGQPQILIVDDDQGGEADRWLGQVIEDINLGWVRWDTEANMAPDLETMQDYSLVIWSTGHASQPLDEVDRQNIAAAVEDSLNVLLMGNRIGDDRSNRDCSIGILRVMHERDSSVL